MTPKEEEVFIRVVGNPHERYFKIGEEKMSDWVVEKDDAERYIRYLTEEEEDREKVQVPFDCFHRPKEATRFFDCFRLYYKVSTEEAMWEGWDVSRHNGDISNNREGTFKLQTKEEWKHLLDYLKRKCKDKAREEMKDKDVNDYLEKRLEGIK